MAEELPQIMSIGVGEEQCITGIEKKTYYKVTQGVGILNFVPTESRLERHLRIDRGMYEYAELERGVEYNLLNIGGEELILNKLKKRPRNM